MKYRFIRVLGVVVALAGCLNMRAAMASDDNARHRILVSSDIGGTDPDDNQSMIHLLMYANEFDIEGLVSSPSFGEGSKEEISRMVAMYARDLPKLECGLKSEHGDSRGAYPSPEYLASITKQGRKGAAPLCGYGESTEGSDWIVKCARKEDSRPLWVLVWGALEDVAQALHDAPDIADKIRVYWIGGPNKKWGCNAYSYIARNFPSLWFIENNASYRGFIGRSSDGSMYQGGFWKTFMKDAGVMGNDFINYYGGNVKMGDTPSLLYLMSGDADTPDSDHWGGKFEPMSSSSCYAVTGQLCAADTVPCYSLMEWRLEGPVVDVAADSVCFTLTVDKQQWAGYHIGDGVYMVRYAPKAPAVLPYVIASEIEGFPVHEGCFTVGEKWNSENQYGFSSGNLVPMSIDLSVVNESGNKTTSWWTDVQDYTTSWQGSATISKWRQDIMEDWSKRFKWLK
ncbi:MAG: DUF1593 domain-containing protein [Bacteroides sp.]|nr:DUF1593 domain-containing protein [Bacteroides sp.]